MEQPGEHLEGFAGLRVVAFESRRAGEIQQLIRRHGGQPLVAPSMQEVPLANQTELFQFGQRLFAGTVDVVILTTGVGTKTLVEGLSTRHPLQEIKDALSKLTLVVRGPKPIIALLAIGLKPTLTVPEPNTWRDILATLDANLKLQGLRVAVQEYGESNDALLDGLRQRGAEVIRVPVYRWTLPSDLGPLQQAIQAICDGQADVLLFTSAQQVEHVLQVAKTLQRETALRQAVLSCVIASVGPVCSEALKHHGFPVDLEPAHPKMGSLLSEAALRSSDLLRHKRP